MNLCLLLSKSWFVFVLKYYKTRQFVTNIEFKFFKMKKHGEIEVITSALG